MNCSPPGSSVRGGSLSKDTAVGCHAFLQGIISNQGLNPGLPHFRWFFTVQATREAQINYTSIKNKRNVFKSARVTSERWWSHMSFPAGRFSAWLDSSHSTRHLPNYSVHFSWGPLGLHQWLQDWAECGNQKSSFGTSQVVQCLRLCAPSKGGLGSILGQGTKIPHAATKTLHSQINIYFKNKLLS